MISPPERTDLEQVRVIPTRGVEAVFFKTRNVPLTVFDPLFPHVTAGAAGWLAQSQLLFVGIDQPGIEINQPAHETHIQLLRQDILILEGLDLSQIDGGRRRFVAFTIGISGGEAEPVMLYALPSTGVGT